MPITTSRMVTKESYETWVQRIEKAVSDFNNSSSRLAWIMIVIAILQVVLIIIQLTKCN